jgi:tetratricopeptide (TPR) repeat protein
LADWAEELGELELYRQASEHLVRIDPHRPVPYGYLADALLRETDEAKKPENRTQAKQYLKRAIELSPDYSYATGRLADLELEDDQCDAAQAAIDLGGKYLAEGFSESYQLRIAAKRSEQEINQRPAVIDQLIGWCQSGPHISGAMLQAVDSFSDTMCHLAISKLVDEIKQRPGTAELGIPLGRLLARIQADHEAVNTLKLLPQDKGWEHTVHYYVRSLKRFDRAGTALDVLLRRFRKRIRLSDSCWAAVASTLLDYGRNADVVNWTKDWRKRSEITAGNYITMIAANWELFRIGEGRKILVAALEQMNHSKDDQYADLLMVWAGLDAIIRGDVQSALNFAQRIAPHNISSWYQLGYRMLISGLELTPQLAEDAQQAQRAIASLSPGTFPVEAQFEKDRLTRWFLRKLQASLWRMYGRRMPSFVKQLQAWKIQFNL